MKTRSLLALFCFVLLVSSCNEDEKQAMGHGKLNLQLSANPEVVEMTTKATTTSTLPEVAEFSLALYKSESLVNSWNRFDEFPADTKFPIGNYSMTASYGDNSNEGFDLPAFSGSQKFKIADEEITDVSITCSLTNVKVSVDYSDEFKKYFSAYTTSILSATGKTLQFTKDESRPAYFKPGSLTVNMAVTNTTGVSSNMEVAKVSDTEARSHYRFHFDVDAGSATLTVTFDDATEEMPITIDISDEALTAVGPEFTTTGFAGGDQLEFVEGAVPESSSISVLMNARSGISGLTLTTESAWLQSQGWPSSIDLAQADDATLTHLRESGLGIKGVGANVTMENFAVVEFVSLISQLQIVGESNTHVFTLSGKDKNNKITQTLQLTVVSLPDHFALVSVDPVMVGADKAQVAVKLDGNVEDIDFHYSSDNGLWNMVAEKEVLTSQGIDHLILVKGIPFGNASKKIVATYKNKRSHEVAVEMEVPSFAISATDADAWAQKAFVEIQVENEDVLNVIKNYGTVFIRKSEESSWSGVSSYSIEGNRLQIGGLTPQTAYTVRMSCLASPQETEYTNEVSFTTEQAVQLPNAGMEEWYSNKTDRYGNPITKNLKYVYWNKFFPWNEADASTRGWNTLNQKTTQDGATPSVFIFPTPPYVGCCYVANSGTIPTDDKYSGSKAALIRSVGWGSGGTAEGNNSTVKHTDAGHLYLGSYNEETQAPDFGIAFTSRPSGVSFQSKYVPKNTEDRFIARMVVLDADNNIIAEGQLPAEECAENHAYSQKTIRLNYIGENAGKKAARMYISFISGTQLDINTTNFEYPPFGNLSDGETVGSKLYIDDVNLLYN